MPGLPFHYPSGLKQSVLWYTGLGFWLSPIIGESPNNCYEWYVPTILSFYLIAPLLSKRSLKTLIIILACAIVLVCIQHETQFCKEIEIATSRLPIFITGFVYYYCCKKGTWERNFYLFWGGHLITSNGIFLYIFNNITSRRTCDTCPDGSHYSK